MVAVAAVVEEKDDFAVAVVVVEQLEQQPL